MSYDNTNKGSLAVNGSKQKETHPDFRGSINIDGKDYWLSGWSKRGQHGEFISLSVQPKDQQQASSQSNATRTSLQSEAASNPALIKSQQNALSAQSSSVRSNFLPKSSSASSPQPGRKPGGLRPSPADPGKLDREVAITEEQDRAVAEANRLLSMSSDERARAYAEMQDSDIPF